VSGIVGTLDPAGRRLLLLIPRRPAPEQTLPPASTAAQHLEGDGGRRRGEARAAEEAMSGVEGGFVALWFGLVWLRGAPRQS